MSIVQSRRGLMHAVAVAFGALTLARGSGRSRTLIQDDEAAAESQVLFTAVVEELPAPPAIVRLVRAVVGPGGELPEQTNEGLAFLLLERGALSLQVEGEAIVSRAERGGTPAAALVPDPGDPVDLRPGDQVAIPTGIPFGFVNEDGEEASLLIALVLPADDRSGGVLPAGGTPEAGEGSAGGAEFDLLGEAVASGWPIAPYLIQLDRVEVGPGEPVPGFPGPVLLAVEEGTLGFALVDGAIQAAGSGIGTPTAAADDTVYRVGSGEAIFFAGGLNVIPRTRDEPTLVMLRFGVASIPQNGGTASETPATGDNTSTEDGVVGAPSSVEAPTGGNAANGERVRVAADGVRLRSAPTTGSDVVAELARGVDLIVTGDPIDAEGLRWLPVQAADDAAVEGFIADQFVEPLP